MSTQFLILVTRTGKAGRGLAEKVSALGFKAIHCPPFELAPPADPKECISDLQHLLPADRVIITSQEGVRRSVELVGADRFDRSLVIVPGEGTATVARDAGIRNVVFPSRHGTSEAMLALPELADVEGLDVLILAAAGGRGLMGQVLERRGASVDRIEVYRRVDKQVPDDLEQQVGEADCTVTLAASWEAVFGLCDAVTPATSDALRKGVLIAPSRRVADRAAGIGFVHCANAGSADDDTMLAELTRITQSVDMR